MVRVELSFILYRISIDLIIGYWVKYWVSTQYRTQYQYLKNNFLKYWVEYWVISQYLTQYLAKSIHGQYPIPNIKSIPNTDFEHLCTRVTDFIYSNDFLSDQKTRFGFKDNPVILILINKKTSNLENSSKWLCYAAVR